MKTIIIKIISPLLIAAAGTVALSQSLSFGWLHDGDSLARILKNHAVVLAVTGVGLLAVSAFVQQLSARVSNLEAQIAALRRSS